MKKKIDPDLLMAGFDAWWAEYPRKVSKADAQKAWRDLAKAGELPAIEVLISAVRAQSADPGWREDNGRFIPYPATWLRKRRWEDRVGATVEAPLPSARPDADEFEDLSVEAHWRVRQALEGGWRPKDSDIVLLSVDEFLGLVRRYRRGPLEWINEALALFDTDDGEGASNG